MYLLDNDLYKVKFLNAGTSGFVYVQQFRTTSQSIKNRQ